MQTSNKLLLGTVVTLVTLIVCAIGIRTELKDARRSPGLALSSDPGQPASAGP